ncbi:MAG: amino acid adenylation domain-containing protein, partial [Acidobacteriota bacterium]
MGTLLQDIAISTSLELRQLALLAKKGAATVTQSPQLPPLLPISQREKLPLSSPQERRLVKYLTCAVAQSNILLPIKFIGQLDIAALKNSLNELVHRHEILRIALVKLGAEQSHLVLLEKPVELLLLDLTALSRSAQEVEIARLADEELDRPFELAQGLVPRSFFLKLKDHEQALLLTLNSLTCDSWSIGVLVNDLLLIYKAFSTGKTNPLSQLPFQYLDFAAKQWEFPDEESLEREASYWKEILASAPLLNLPCNRSHSLNPASLVGKYPIFFSQNLSNRLKALGQQLDSSLFMLLLTVFKILLYRYTEQDNIIIGTVSANRNYIGMESLVGPFAGSLALRTNLSGNPSFIDLLIRVREACLGALTHQAPCWEKPSVIFALDGSPLQLPELSQLNWYFLEIYNRRNYANLTLEMIETEQGLIGLCTYKLAMFDSATISRLAGHFQTLLEALVVNPQQRIANLPLLTTAELHQLFQWNQTQEDFAQDRCIHELFEQQVTQTPDATAVIFNREILTYRELNEEANQLAHYLRRLGVGPEVLVGICLPRSFDMVIAILAVLKAGGAYVPLDPSYPRKRLLFMLNDCQSLVLLTQQGLLEEWQESNTHVVCLDLLTEALLAENKENLIGYAISSNLAYVIYTSGSTGWPKGVMLTHQGVCNLAKVEIESFQLHPHSRVLQFASLSFDASVWELCMALLAGATICLATPEQLLPGLHLSNTLHDYSITIATFPPSALAVMPVEEFSALETIIIAGETCPANIVSEWSTGRRFFNAYGPTEVTVCASFGECNKNEPSTSIGRPIANTEIYILDRQGEVVPIGVCGEIYIGGVGLARGYLNNADLTATRFIPNRFSTTAGQRLYRSGDLARYLSDGKIEFVGRIDAQVKLRGYRIELGEIEAALRAIATVREAVVMLREDQPGQAQLVAYLVSRTEQLSLSELRTSLQQRLPQFMIPSLFVILPTLPLTSNGKVDRRALPSPAQESIKYEDVYQAASNAVEEVVAGIWAAVLKRAQVGIMENFFEIGGHSLLATQVISRIRDAFGIELSLHTIFEFPTVAGLAAYITSTLDKAQPSSSLSIQPAPRDGRLLPLSFSQERVWFIQQLDPTNKAYHAQAILRFTGTLNVKALTDSLNEIVRRHEIFRTTFPVIDAHPVQIIHPPQQFNILTVDLETLGISCEVELQKLIEACVEKNFDLTILPLVNWTLFRLNQREHVLLHVEHHLVHDGWSFNVFLTELFELYRAFSADRPSPLPDLTIQFADFAYWQRQWLESAEAQAQLNYWKERLASIPPLLELPTDHPRPTKQSFLGETLRIGLPLNLTHSLIELSHKQSATLFMVLLAAFKVLLYRYSGQKDILLGTGVANRRQREIEGLIGMIINNIVLRTELHPQMTFLQLLYQVRETALEAYQHQDLPFSKVVEALPLVRNLSYNPVFQVAFAFHDTPLPELTLPELTVHLTEGLSNRSAKFDLDIIAIPRSNIEENLAMTLLWTYSTDLFEATTIARMADYFHTLLTGIVADSYQSISSLPLLSEVERNQLLVEWNKTALDYSAKYCFHQLFEEQVRLQPKAIAVRSVGAELTYQELNYRANQLAHYLKRAGVGPETLVGICLDRSLAMIIGMLGIFKAGGAYVPLDPSYSQERLAFMIEDTRMLLVLTEQRLVMHLPSNQTELIFLDKEWEIISEESVEDLVNTTIAENLAYIIYTSGSTGLPKGVMIQHNSLVNYLQWVNNSLLSENVYNLPVLTKISFDASLKQLFGPLLNGKAIWLLPDEILTQPSRLIQILSEQTKVGLNCVPSLWQSLLEILSTEQLAQLAKSITALFIGGEQLSKGLVNSTFSQMPYVQIWNLYGPTEATANATTTQITATDKISIGRPIANTEIYILDRQGEVVPIGVCGEIYIGGVGLARGYLNNADLTATRFIPNRFSTTAGQRLYRSGDLARYLSDGKIEFVGRIDAQVKLRGYRIELGEIEAALRAIATVREAVVMLREDQPGQAQLVAYLVSRTEQLSLSELRTSLQQRLPQFMIPSLFVILPTLPLTSNGKVDRRALPSPAQESIKYEDVYQAASNAVEEVVAGIWAAVLKRAQVGIMENFFEIGGHSLLATQVISRIRDAFGIELSLHTIFEFPTVAGLTVSITDALRTVQGLQLPSIKAAPRDISIPLSFAQQRLWFLDRLEPDSNFYNISQPYLFNGSLKVAALSASINEIISRHEVLRTSFGIVNGKPVQIIAPILKLILPVVNLRELSQKAQEDEVERLTIAEAEASFNLSQGPLLRVKLLQLADQEHILLLTMHHIVADAWSLDLIVKELSILYRDFCQGRSITLPNLAIQYADFALWQRQCLQGEVLAAHLDYWRKQLGDRIPLLNLPTDRPRPTVQTYLGAKQSLILPEHIFEALKVLSLQERSTLFMVLLAAFKLLLYKYTGQEDIIVGSPVAGRNRSEIEDLVGFFVNILGLRTNLSGNPSFQELLARVREVALQAYAHQDLPVEKLVEELQPKRD